MYLLKEGSKDTEDALFIKIKKNDKLLFFPENNVATWIYEKGIPEKNLIYWVIDNFIFPDKNFIDIGAHVGTYSWTCGKNALHTFSFECNYKIFGYLMANIILHGLEDKITALPVALGNCEKDEKYYVRSPDGGGNGCKMINDNDNDLYSYTVKVKTLDSFNLSNISLIKIDVEGYEKEVLQGAVQTIIKNNYPPILFESWGEWKFDVDKSLQKELFDYIYKLGYTIKSTIHNDMFIALK